MRKIFIADAHLKAPCDANYRALVRFLEALPPDTDTLYLLGDLFEFWVGDPDPVYRQYREIIECLKGVRNRGVRIVYFEGNHDFHLAPFFRRELQAEVHTEGTVLEIAGQRVYLCHGDQVNRGDRGYRILRLVLHSPLLAALVPLLPESLKGWIAARLSRKSSRQHAQRRVRWDYPALIRAFAGERFSTGCDAVVTGHFHLPFIERENGQVLLALGDWITQYSYGQWLDGAFTLEHFFPAGSARSGSGSAPPAPQA